MNSPINLILSVIGIVGFISTILYYTFTARHSIRSAQRLHTIIPRTLLIGILATGSLFLFIFGISGSSATFLWTIFPIMIGIAMMMGILLAILTVIRNVAVRFFSSIRKNDY